MRGSIEIRTIRHPEITCVASLIRDTIRSSYAVVYPPRAVEFFLNYHTDTSIVQRAVDGLVMVAEWSGEMVATGSIVEREITGVFVRPDFQGKGIGSLVMDRLEASAVQSGYEHVTLSISLPSRTFYENRGYEITEAAPIHVGMGQVLDYWRGKKILGGKSIAGFHSGLSDLSPIRGSLDTGAMNDMTVTQAHSQSELREVDNLLWHCLWLPLGFPRDIRQSFHLEGPQREFCVRSEKGIVGAVVVRMTSSMEQEICHIAVTPDAQRQGIGRTLIECVIDAARQDNCPRIRVIARNTSAGFFKRVGFNTIAQDVPDHPEFKKHGITFLSMEMSVKPQAHQETAHHRKPNSGDAVMILQPIGVIHSPFHTKDDCPIQPLYASKAPGRVEVFSEYEKGLKDIETFSHICLLYRFDRAGKIQMVRSTFLDDVPHGIFATRHPCRPNGIGISIVKLVSRYKNILEVEGVDILNSTPLLDIKPYIPRFDRINRANEGWVAGKKWRPKPHERE